MPEVEKELSQAAERVKKMIKLTMIDKNLTQADISRVLKVSQSQISRAISGENTPRAREIRQKIYVFLNMDK